MVFLIQQTMIYAIPLMIVALAGIFAERSGIINLALENIMIFGAFCGVLFVRIMQENNVFTQQQGQLLMAAGWQLRRRSGLYFHCFLLFQRSILRRTRR